MGIQKAYTTFLNRHYDARRAKKEKKYLYSPFKHYGVSAVKRREFTKAYKKEIQGLNRSKTLELIKLFWNKPSYEEKCMTLSILNMNIKYINLSDQKLIEKMVRESVGWALLDGFVMQVCQTWYEESPTKTEKILQKWIRDKDFWVRRSALLAQLLLFREGRGNKDLFFDMAKNQFDESWIDENYAKYSKDKNHILHPNRAKFFIRKAIGWVLREMSTREKDRKLVVDFCKQYKSKMSGLSYREALRKL